MQKEAVFSDEGDRLKELLSLNVLDTPPEAMFDEITTIAASYFQVPIAAISIVDEERVWFKSQIGISLNEIERNSFFCNFTIQNREVFVVEDAQHDERFKNNIFLNNDKPVLFYAGMPLSTLSGNNIGSLFVMDYNPKKIQPEDVHFLKLFSKIVITYFLMNKQNSRIKVLHDVIAEQALKIRSETEQFLRSEKIASLVDMSASIAHEINNPLTIIHGKTSYLLDLIENGNIDIEKINKNLSSILQNSDRIANIVKGLKYFASDSGSETVELTKISTIINNAINIMNEKLISHKVNLHINLSENIEIECISFQICQCILNLMINSIEAINDLDSKWISIDVADQEQENTVKIQITDSGHGISNKEILANIMQPFQTTKNIGKGVGLGLSVIYGIVQAHKGEFIYDESCENTRFIITLPKKSA